jgi:hypothetical protein
MSRKSEHESEKQQKTSRKEKDMDQSQVINDEDIPVESKEQAIEEIRAAAEKSGYAKQVQEEARKREHGEKNR